MLWSQGRPHQPSAESRRAGVMVRRSGWVLGVLLPSVMVMVVAWRP
ncbi:morphogenic membrane protein MmpB [Streptantibioticus silvisoli]|uniref:Uncharacterized protein n=1 Tax=Streptantibioticus silvisoli TaxID=2705255 RepID=A0ABT6W927_9ACTN|nr:hypothetical protein [Streptantibioticus silvisoli]MDI5966865.1 hypothetical protein [Streptantibioticus silvisoli]